MALPHDPLCFASAISDADDTAEALDEVLGVVEDALGERGVDLVLAFVSPHHRNGFAAIARAIRARLDPGVVVGLTAGGVLGSGEELESRPGLSILAGRLPGVRLRAFDSETLQWPPDEEGEGDSLRRNMVDADVSADEPAGILLFADPFSTPLTRLLPAITQAFPGTPLIGGLCSGGPAAGDNRLLLDDQVTSEGLVGVSLVGKIRVDCTVSQGCRPVGQPWVITDARHNLIQQIGGRPVLEVVREMVEAMDGDDRRAVENGLFVGRVIDEYKERFGRGDFLVRNILGADEDSGYLAIGDLVRPGQSIQFHVRDAQAAREDMRLLLEGQKIHGPVSGVMLCTCSGRGTHLFSDANVDSALIQEALGAVPLAGFFAAGEIGPIGRQNFVHGFTASLAAFRDPAAV